MKNNYRYGSLAPFRDSAALAEQGAGAVSPLPGRALEVEIGSGTGEYLAGLAAALPDTDFVGLETCPERVVKTLRKLHAGEVGNVRVFLLDAVLAFRCLFPRDSLARVHCLFPCPWPRLGQAKHRLFRRSFLIRVRSRLRPGGMLRIVTDHHPYADWIAEQAADTGFSVARGTVGAAHDTKFERKWRAGGQEAFSELVLTADRPCPPLTEEEAVQVYFLPDCDPARMALVDEEGPVSIVFLERLHDAGGAAAMVHAVVTEDGCRQHLWIALMRTSKGWRIAPAAGTAALPTEGTRRSVAAVYHAALATARG